MYIRWLLIVNIVFGQWSLYICSIPLKCVHILSSYIVYHVCDIIDYICLHTRDWNPPTYCCDQVCCTSGMCVLEQTPVYIISEAFYLTFFFLCIDDFLIMATPTAISRKIMISQVCSQLTLTFSLTSQPVVLPIVYATLLVVNRIKMVTRVHTVVHLLLFAVFLLMIEWSMHG